MRLHRDRGSSSRELGSTCTQHVFDKYILTEIPLYKRPFPYHRGLGIATILYKKMPISGPSNAAYAPTLFSNLAQRRALNAAKQIKIYTIAIAITNTTSSHQPPLFSLHHPRHTFPPSMQHQSQCSNHHPHRLHHRV
jgi:hypothetical protein